MFVCTPTDLLFEVSFESVSLISRKDLEVGSIGHRADDKVGLSIHSENNSTPLLVLSGARTKGSIYTHVVQPHT